MQNHQLKVIIRRNVIKTVALFLISPDFKQTKAVAYNYFEKRLIETCLPIHPLNFPLLCLSIVCQNVCL